MKKLIVLIILAVGITFLSNSNEYVEIPSSSIRMRVIANSNKEEDQNKKVEIKSILEEKLYDLTKGAKSEEEIDRTIEENKSSIDEYLKSEISNRGLDVAFTSNYGLNYFPEKEFKGLTYKSGNYKSYVLTLGTGEGENWWCVLYPPLCLVDENKEDYEYHYLIKDILAKYN